MFAFEAMLAIVEKSYMLESTTFTRTYTFS